MVALPVVWFVSPLSRIPATSDGWALAVGAAAALSVFGFHRFTHAFVATRWHACFYTDSEWGALVQEPNTFLAHALGGVLYLVAPILVLLVTRYA